jgi:hypothetical protein
MSTTTRSHSVTSSAIISSFIMAFIRRHPGILVWALGIICIGMVGCSDPAGPAEAKVVRPGMGSMYVYKVTQDTGGGAHVYYDTVIVSRTGLRIGGRTNVVELSHLHNGKSGYNFKYLCYEPNGDIGMAMPAGQHLDNGDTTVWNVYSVGSRMSKECSIESGSGYTEFPTVRITSDYVVAESLTVGDEKLGAHKFRTTYVSISRAEISYSNELFVWFSPSIGNISRWMNQDKGEQYELFDYFLKP